MKKIKVGIFGTGFGLLVTMPAIKHIKEYDLVGIYGRNIKKLERIKKKNDIEIYNKIDELLDKIDLAIISLPPFLHFDVLVRALKKNKHILCEKPFTLNHAQAKKILLISRKKRNQIFSINYQMRFQPLRIKLKRMLDIKKIGKIISFRYSYDYSSRLYQKKHNWWSNVRLGGGVINAMGSHQLDLLTWLFGEIVEVKSLKKSIFSNSKSNVDDVASCLLKFKNEIIGSLNLSSAAVGWKTSSMDIYGTKGAIFLRGERELFFSKKTNKNKQENVKLIKINFREPLFKKKWVDNSIWRASHFRLLNNLAQSILFKKKFRGATFEEGYKIRELLDKILK